MTLHDIAELQSVYSQLYLSGQVSDDTYTSVINATMVSLNGINSYQLEMLAKDLNRLDTLKGLIPKIRKKCD